MNGRGRIGTAGLLVALGLLLAGAVSAQVRPDRDGPTARPAPPVGVPTPKKPDAPVRGGQICAVAYEDRNANGRRDGGEGPLAGQSFTIANAAGAQLAEGASGGDGRFCTPRTLPLGDYRVRLIPGGGLTNTDPGAASLNVRSVALRTEGAVTVLFGSCRGERCAVGAGVATGPVRSGPKKTAPRSMGKICITKYNDLNRNGQRDPGEPGMAGWVFIIDGDPYQLFFTTGADGSVCHERSEEAWAVMESNSSGPYLQGWTNTDPGSPYCSGGSTPKECFTFTGVEQLALEFGNWKPATVTLTKTVTSTAPGGGYPTTGLATGGSFPVKLNCPLAAMNTLANVPAGQTRTLNNVPVGAVCTVTETLPQGSIPYAACPTGSGYWESPLINSSPITVASGTNAVTVSNRFVCNAPPPPGKVCVTKYNDVNGDGVRQSGEPGLTGWNFTVRNVNGVAVTTLTSTSGYPACSPFILPPGNYTIEEVLTGTAWKNTDPGGGAIEPFTVAAGGTANAVFGNVQLGRICVRKYNDVNGNGAWSGSSSAPEPFMTGVPFQVTNSSGQVVHTGLTAALGVYCTPNTLMPGTYTITETVPGGWTNTQPGGAASVTVTLPAPGGAPPNIWFGNRKNPLPGELCVEKYNDLNGDGDQDPGEGPLQGWTFTRSGGGMSSLSGSTNANGRWCPGTMVPPGTYTVTETMKSGWTSKDPGGLTPVKTALVVTNQTTIVKFGNQQDPLPSEICVRKYNDLNNNGARDAGEPPLSSWQFTVRNSSNTIVGVGSTGGAGQWCTPTLIPPGTYTVTETPQAGWTNTDPGGSTPVKTVVVGSNAASTVWFGNRQP
ncbi:hypothetical protein MCEMIH16_00439 [Caulobacteraceae bacterium]